jgi:hypothetical protein
MKLHLQGMDEAKAREITSSKDLSGYSCLELRKADEWIQNYALTKLQLTLTEKGVMKEARAYIALMARCHYGSVETDEFLMSMNCYPSWLQNS